MSDIEDGEDLEFLTAFEDELYNETSSVGSDESLDSELEAELYQNVHFASSFVETSTDNVKGLEEKDLNESSQSIGLKSQVKESDYGEGNEERLNEETTCFVNGEEEKDKSKCFYPEVDFVFSKDEQKTKAQKIKDKKSTAGKLFQPKNGNDENSLSESDNEWGLLAADVTPVHQKRKQRNIRCFNCNERGHRTLECTEPKKVNVCFLCGEVGHKRRCPNELCFNCSEPGHQVKNCSKPRSRGKDVCNRCHAHGHFESFCPDRWRQYHHTIKEGEIVRAKQPDLERKVIFCYNCGGKGHLGHECVEETQERFFDASVPFVVKYDRFTSDSTRYTHRDHQTNDDTKQNHQHGTWSQNRKKRSGKDVMDGAGRSSKRRKMEDGGDDHGWNYADDNYDRMETFTDFGNASTQLPQALMSVDIALRRGKKKKRKRKNSQEQSEFQNGSTQIPAKKKKNRPNQFKRKRMKKMKELENLVGKQNNDDTQTNNVPMGMPPTENGEVKNKKKKKGKRKNKFAKKDKINLASLSSLSSTAHFHSMTNSTAHVSTERNPVGNHNQDKRVVINTPTKAKKKDGNKHGDKRNVYFNYTGFL